MRPLAATDCITPAINRTKSILFQPFRYGRSWKLAATAYLSSMALFFPAPFLLFPAFHPTPQRSFLFLGIILSLALTAFYFLFFCLGAKLEFVLFDIVLLREQFVAPSWSRHAPHSWRWIGFRILFSLAASILSAPFFILGFRNMLAHIPATSQPGQPPSPEMIGSVFLLYALVGIPIGLTMLFSSLLGDFMLPPIALEDTTVREALRRFTTLARLEPGPVSLFVLFKTLLVIAGFVAMEAAILVAEIILAIPLGLTALAGYFLLRSAGEAGHLMMMIGGALLFILFAASMIYAMVLIMGCLYIFFKAFALYFLGGRYHMLGDILDPQQPDPGYTPAVVPPLPPPVPDPNPAF